MRSRSVSRALVVCACALGLSAAPAHAGLELPDFTTPVQIGAPGNPVAAMGSPLQNLAVDTKADGTVVAAWVAYDGANDRVAYAERSPQTHQWTPQQWLTPEGVSIAGYYLDVDDHGNTSVLYADTSVTTVYAITRLAGSGTWSLPEGIVPGGDSINAVATTTAPGGRTAFAWSYSSSGVAGTAVVVREADSTSWGTPERVGEDTDQTTRDLTIDFNAHGDASLVYMLNVWDGGTTELRASRFDHVGGDWSGAEKLADTDGSNAMLATVMTDAGEAGAIWAASSVDKMTAAATVNGEWQAAERLDDGNGQMQVLPSIVADNTGRMLVTFQPTPMDFSDARVVYSVFDGGEWSDAVQVPGAQHAGAAQLATNASGEVVLLHAGDGSDSPLLILGAAPLSAVRWDSSTETWGTPRVIAGASVQGFRNIARGAVDEFGNVIALWSDGDDFSARSAAADRSAPVISSVSVPGAATAGKAVNVSATASDIWSDVGVDWDFGDGGLGDGATDSHVFTVPGTYTVTVTASDATGNESTATRQIAVAAAPVVKPPAPPAADDDQEDTVVEDVKPPAKKQPVVSAPVIDAKLAGKTITYSAKLTLKKGHKCTGKVQATFRYGNKRYKSNLKLKKVGNACRATGKTTLKKTPSARTKITIKITGKHIKTRSLATKRG